MCRFLPLAVVLLSLGLSGAQAPLTFEAEDWSEPKDAWVPNKDVPGKWNLWSTDVDADKKWSGGVVLRGPILTADLATPEEGAPPLHTRITGIPAGTYDVSVKVGRTLAVSLDGKEWKPYRGGVITRVTIEDGIFELWVDDRFAHPEPGSCYYDCVLLTPVLTAEGGISNAGYEEGPADGVPATWSWWSREGRGSATAVTDERHSGERSVHIVHDGERDWALSCAAIKPVKPGDELVISGWVKCVDSGRVEITVVGRRDGELVSWNIGAAGVSGTCEWKRIQGPVLVPEGVNEVSVRWVGSGKTNAWVDDVALTPGRIELPKKPPVTGWASERVAERLDRGVVALPTGDGMYLSWRLLKSDPPDVAFNVYRHRADGRDVKVNAEPIRHTTDAIDPTPEGAETYLVRPVVGGRELPPDGFATMATGAGRQPYVSIRLQGDYRAQKIAIADLDGDGRYDYVIKQPEGNVDPYVAYWEKSPETYKIEAYLHDGTFLWRNDLGWAIERGIWYSPWLAHDLNGDGKAEVAAKIGEGDPRDEDGRVQSGPEWLAVWDGLTGEEIARAPWPSREGFSDYNLASRNQLAVAYLDGKTPCLIALRGTYSLMKAEAWMLRDGALEPLWQYSNEDLPRNWWGQGAHFTHCADIDGDGRDEVLLGSAVLDDSGAPLWSTGLGHPDHAYLGDIDPRRPGLEIYYGIETRGPRNTMCQVDAATGKILWGWDQPTKHIHGTGMCADIDPVYPGLEAVGADAEGHTLTDQRWLWAADGTIISRAQIYGFGVNTVYWDADLQKEILSGATVKDHLGGVVATGLDGSVVLIADVIGDWREEVLACVPGELRIYSTTIPANDRRVCLLQDPIYRADVTMVSMGYTQVPMLSYCPEATAPNLNLTAMNDDSGEPFVQVVASAPLDRGLRGTVVLVGDGVRLSTERIAADLPPGERIVERVRVEPAGAEGAGSVRGVLEGLDHPLRASVTFRLSSRPLTGVPMVQAEQIAEQGGGEVRIRDDKAGVVEKAISHWDSKGHWLLWRITVPKDGAYRLVLRYSAAQSARRTLAVDGQALPLQSFAGSGGFGDAAGDWQHATAVDEANRPLTLQLGAGEHTIRMENVDGQGLNLDYVALVPAP